MNCWRSRRSRAGGSSSKIIEGLDGVTRARAYFLSVVTGLRRRELASLTRSAFTLDGSDPRLVVEAAFSKHRRRDEVRLPTYTTVELRLWLASLKADEPLVPKLANRKTHKMIRKDLEAAGLPYRDEKGCFLDWHALRHTCITRAWRSGATATVVQQIARHSDIRETMGYSHTTGGEIRQAVDAVPPLRLDGEAGVA